MHALSCLSLSIGKIRLWRRVKDFYGNGVTKRERIKEMGSDVEFMRTGMSEGGRIGMSEGGRTVMSDWMSSPWGKII